MSESAESLRVHVRNGAHPPGYEELGYCPAPTEEDKLKTRWAVVVVLLSGCASSGASAARSSSASVGTTAAPTTISPSQSGHDAFCRGLAYIFKVKGANGEAPTTLDGEGSLLVLAQQNFHEASVEATGAGDPLANDYQRFADFTGQWKLATWVGADQSAAANATMTALLGSSAARCTP